MLTKLLLLFVVVPSVELALLLVIAAYTSWQLTLVLVILTGILGANLARLQGWQTYLRIQHELNAGRLPADALLDALMIFIAGALLITPGVLTDAFGFSLLVPRSRSVYRARLTRWLKSRFKIETFTPPETSCSRGDQIIDSYVVDRDDHSRDHPSQ